MYNNAQVIIDLDEYNELKKKVEAFEKGNDNSKEDFLLATIVSLTTQLSKAGMKADIPVNLSYGLALTNTNPPTLKVINK